MVSNGHYGKRIEFFHLGSIPKRKGFALAGNPILDFKSQSETQERPVKISEKVKQYPRRDLQY